MENYDRKINVFHINQRLETEIEIVRKKLNNLVTEKNEDLLDSEVLKLSEYLDELIVQYNKKDQEQHLMSLDNISGVHATFYYYGKNHLFANIVQYIKHGIENNELIYIYMKPSLYDELLYFLDLSEISHKNIAFYPVKELISINKKNGLDGLDGLKKKINILNTEASQTGYNGIRLVGQPSHAIDETSKEDFLNFESNLTAALNNTNVSILCIYDYDDYIHHKKIIDEKIINESLYTHSHVLSKFHLQNLCTEKVS